MNKIGNLALVVISSLTLLLMAELGLRFIYPDKIIDERVREQQTEFGWI